MNKLDRKYVNQILCRDCLGGMRKLPDECIPLTITSPPYDGLRDYGGHPFDFEPIADQLYRITMVGGVVVWIVQEQIIDSGETETTSYQRLYFKKIGFRIHHTMIMYGYGIRHHHNVRHGGPLQYAFILSKGKPRHITLIRDRLSTERGRTRRFLARTRDGQLEQQQMHTTKRWGVRGPIWYYATGRHIAQKEFTNIHPARMAEGITRDHILSWSVPGDVILDPFAGVGTTCKMALLNHRRYLGFEIYTPYWERAMQRMALAHDRYNMMPDAELGLSNKLRLSHSPKDIEG